MEPKQQKRHTGVFIAADNEGDEHEKTEEDGEGGHHKKCDIMGLHPTTDNTNHRTD
jgi:hypothetical protein